MSWWEEIVKSPDVAGTAGAVLGWLSAPGKNLREQLFNFGAGIGCAIFLAPYAAERAAIESQAGKMAFAFLLGLVGMSLLPKLMGAAKNSDWRGLLAAMLPKGKKP